MFLAAAHFTNGAHVYASAAVTGKRVPSRFFF